MTHSWVVVGDFLFAGNGPGYAHVWEPKDTLFQVSTVKGLEYGYT